MLVDKNNYSIDPFLKSYLLISNSGKRFERFAHLRYAISKISIEGSVLEFGVWTARTTNLIAELLPNNTVYGFDSFEGLPEDWAIYKRELDGTQPVKHTKGHFKSRGLPQVRDNVELVKGFFDSSLNPWIAKHPDVDPIKFLHIDSDLYSSAKFVLTALNKYIIPGTIIVFDEFYPFKRKGYDTWPEHEYKALYEWTSENNRVFEPISHSQHQQTAIKMVQ